MTREDFDRFSNAMGTCWEALSRNEAPIPPRLIKAYFTVLMKYNIADLEHAILQAACSCTFFPKPVELIEFMQHGKPDDHAVTQAGEVLDAIRHIGPHRTVMFSDPVTTKVINSIFGGWVKLGCELEESKEKWFVKEFVEAYKSYAKNRPNENQPCIGMFDSENIKNGHAIISKPVLIGHADQKQIEFKDKNFS